VEQDHDVGGVNVIYGSPVGLSSDGSQFWWRRLRALMGSLEDQAHFGLAVA